MTQSNSVSQANTSSTESAYFNLHASGCGYLSRVRWVKPDKRGGRSGDQFLACAVNALRGDVSDPAYTYFDLRVNGEEAIELVQQLKEHVDEDAKVFVAFKLGDIYVHTYERDARDENKRPTGKKEHAACIKGRLLLITHAQVNGEVVYSRDENDEQHDESHGDRQSDEEVDQSTPADAADEPQAARQPVQETRDHTRVQRRPPANRQPVDRTRVRGYAEA